MKTVERWFSDRLEQEFTVARWGHFGVPVLVLPTAGGDAEEIERHKLCGVLRPRCSRRGGSRSTPAIPSPAGRWRAAPGARRTGCGCSTSSTKRCATRWCRPSTPTTGGSDQRIVTAGASIGAFNAVALLCRFPDVFEAAIGMSGTYRIQRFLEGAWSDDLFYSSPLDFLPGLDGDQLEVLRQRRVILPSGEGEHEDIGESWAMAEVLGSKGVPNRARLVGAGDHPRLADLVADAAAVPRRSSPSAFPPPPQPPPPVVRGTAPRPGSAATRSRPGAALVRAVRAGVGLLDPGDQDLRVGERVGERRHERDGPADPDLDHGLPERLAVRRSRRRVGRARGVRGDGATGLPALTMTRRPRGRCPAGAREGLAGSSGSSPGAIRSASLARAEGTSSRPTSSTAGASIATTDSEGSLPEPRGQ